MKHYIVYIINTTVDHISVDSYSSFNPIANGNGLCMSLLLESSDCFISTPRQKDKINWRKNQLCRLGLGNKVKCQDKLLLKSAEDLI